LSASIGIFLGVKTHKAVFSDAHVQPRLIDSGVYSRVRHPMYLGTLLFCLGFFLSSFSLLSLVIWVGFFAFYDKMTAYEEKDLVRLLGKQYITYQNKVPKWIPQIRTKD
jgi:protein-S-isoprenylcysteine O-methyltransferase Ste14